MDKLETLKRLVESGKHYNPDSWDSNIFPEWQVSTVEELLEMGDTFQKLIDEGLIDEEIPAAVISDRRRVDLFDYFNSMDSDEINKWYKMTEERYQGWYYLAAWQDW